MILFAPDPHGSTQQIIGAGLKLNPSAIITVGDNEFPKKRLDIMFSPLFDIGIPVYTIEGNHPSNHTHLKANRKFMLDGKVIEVEGIRIAGSTNYSKRNSFREEERADILVVHEPPVSWRHPKSKEYTSEMEYLKRTTIAEAERLSVKTIIHGHIHSRLCEADVGLYMLSNGIKVISTAGHFYDQNGNLYGHEVIENNELVFKEGANEHATFIDEKYRAGQYVESESISCHEIITNKGKFIVKSTWNLNYNSESTESRLKRLLGFDEVLVKSEREIYHNEYYELKSKGEIKNVLDFDEDISRNHRY